MNGFVVVVVESSALRVLWPHIHCLEQKVSTTGPSPFSDRGYIFRGGEKHGSRKIFVLFSLLSHSCILVGFNLWVSQSRFFLVCVASVSAGLGSKPLFRFLALAQFFARENTENPVPRSFFAPKPHGNACYAGSIFFSQSCLAVCIFLQSYKNWGLGLACTRRNTLVSPFLGSLVIHQPFLPLCWIWFSGPCQ